MTNLRASEDRYQPAAERVYRNDRIEVTWEPGLCIHFAACIRGSIQAFNPRRKPWVNVDAESPERIAEIVGRCPTGALHARWTDGRPAEAARDSTSVLPTLDGPLFVRGHVSIVDRQGNLVRQDSRMALCRCGQSKNKPFCDNSHYDAAFESKDPAFGEEPDDPDDLVR
jgi:uncharacterized Fe-S cluster protein YjdI/CDGSH-type Zn-finger protein